MISLFRKIAILEGVSYLLLGFTMILKYQYQMPLPNYIVGMAHGGLFIAYVVFLGLIALKYKPKFAWLVLAFAASLVPFGTFVADLKMFKPLEEVNS
jgi:integral membrane protein